MSILLTTEQLVLKKHFRDFVDSEIIPIANRQDETEYLDNSIIEKMSALGFLGAIIPSKYGGKEWDAVTLALLHEEIGRGCASIRSLLTVHEMVALAINRWGSDEQRENWLPRLATGDIIGAFALSEPDTGSDAKSVQLTAVFEGGRFLLSGVKKWITMGQIANLFIIIAQYDNKPTAFLVERQSEGLSARPIKGLMGFRASMGAELLLDDCDIPGENIIGSCGVGLSHIAQTCLDHGRFVVACGCVGLAQACLEDSVNYARERKQFGERLSKNQLIQKMIAEMSVKTKAARHLCQYAALLRASGDPNSINETLAAKYFASTILDKITSDAVQIHGANGCSSSYRVGRYYRDAKIYTIIEGTTQMHELLISKNTMLSIKRAQKVT